jgi:hypothetical protein
VKKLGVAEQHLDHPDVGVLLQKMGHADQARRHIGKPRFHRATRPLMTKHDRVALIKANNVE